ncbi:hypothetical protein ORIO_12530 [Cereibacter azotoformans]|uniref:phage head-tail joining protein n=1 Tax=Cereibacter azotoformans TaxID=43057 RepID=UPI001EEAD216|nr:hypothetical protein [Cereibacter azotoformans]ULB10729.1 hypothetical protein ORIO_12530 [Cereibacter azotoformans]
MSWTQADIDRAKANYAKNTLRVHLSNGEEVAFTDGADMLKRIRVMEAEVGSSSATTFVQTYPRTNRGL